MKCNEWHHRVEQVEHVLQHVAEDGHGVLLLGGARFAVDHGLLDFKVAGADSVASSHTKFFVVLGVSHAFFVRVGLYFRGGRLRLA